MANQTMNVDQLRKQVRLRQERYNRKEFPVFIRADYAVPHATIKQVMDVCTEMGVWQFSVLAVADDKTKARPRLHPNKK